MQWLANLLAGLLLTLGSLFGFNNHSAIVPPATTDQGLTIIYSTNGTPTDFAKKDEHLYINNGNGYELRIPNSKADPALDSIDLDSFVAVDAFGGYMKDKNHVYISTAQYFNVLDRADPATFHSATSSDGSYDSEDKNYRYLNGKIVSAVKDFPSWLPLSQAPNSNYKLKEGIIHLLPYLEPDVTGSGPLMSIDASLKDVDVQTFEVFPYTASDVSAKGYSVRGGALFGNYAIDKNSVYWNSSIITGADPKTFSVILDGLGHITGYAKDARHIYVDDNVLPNADVSSFALIEDGNGSLSAGYLGWAKDKNDIYSGMQVVTNADVATFVSINDSSGNWTGYAKDKSHVYTSNFIQGTTVIEGANPDTFVPK